MKLRILLPALLTLLTSVGIAQSLDASFFIEADKFFKTHVKNGLLDYGKLATNNELKSLMSQIETANINGADDNTTQAFYINAYNLHVINNVVKDYPINSVREKNGFFDKVKVKVANKEMTLNQLEKNSLIKVYQDPRFHFVLVCGALGCPPITNFAYTPQDLENQLEQQTKLAMNDANFIKYNNGKLQLSEIFKWYAKDFGSGSSEILGFINQYRTSAISSDAKISHYPYDWSLNVASISSGTNNNIASNAFRYIVSSTIPKGSIELKIFNNLYSQKTGENRSSFFTTSLSAFYGLSSKFNVGVNARFRKIRNNPSSSSPFSVFGSGDDGTSRSGLTAIGPQIRYAPVPQWTNFSIQSSFVFPIGQDLAGSDTEPYIDWTGATWNTQFFNDFSIGNKFSLFTEIDFLIEDLGGGDEHINRISTPVTLIFSYVPTTKLTLYTLGGYSPYWQADYDYFSQYGVGTKYQFTPNFEIELLYTDFSNKFLNEVDGQAETINLGIRINI